MIYMNILLSEQKNKFEKKRELNFEYLKKTF